MLKLRLEEGSREDGGSRLDGRMRQFETSERYFLLNKRIYIHTRRLF